jgi:anti-sigma regulatory factor (Ser/Thr protein kinase)
MVYNDAFANLLGSRHPRAWGRSAAVVVPEAWLRPGLADVFDRVLAGGAPVHDDGTMLGLSGGQPVGPEAAYLVRSYSAVRDSAGTVLGVLAVAVEVTAPSTCVSGAEHGSRRVPRWHGIELWDEVIASPTLIWSGLRAGARPPRGAVTEAGQRFVAEIGGMPHRLADAQVLAPPARNLPMTIRTFLGGAFYDGFALPDGRLAVAIGDVIGGCAIVAGQVRAGLRAAAVASSAPDAIFTGLDELVSSLHLVGSPHPSESARSPDGHSSDPADVSTVAGQPRVTALLGLFDPVTGEMLLASAGHDAPVVVHCATKNEQVAPKRSAGFAAVEPGPALGVSGARPVLRLVLAQGDALVAFSDGLLEREGRSKTEGQTALLRALSKMASTTPRSICHYVAKELIGADGPGDDCVLLGVVHDRRVHQMATVMVPPQASAVLETRRWVRAQLQSWGLDEELAAAVVMGISELVTNVVLHAGTPARVSLELADRLLVTVEDSGASSGPQRETAEDPTALRGRGLALVAAISDAMGHTRSVGGSTVWFEMALEGRPTP